MEKHEVGPETPAPIAPSTPEQLAVGAAVEVTQTQPESQPETISPRQEKIAQLEAEDIALDFLGRAAATNKKITDMTRGQTKLRLEGKNQEKQTRLGHSIEASDKNRSRFRRVAKKHFGLSKGIATKEITVPVTTEVRGVERDVKKVVAACPEQQAELEESYGPFLKQYEDKPARRTTRRAEITQEIAAIKADVDRAAGDTASRLGNVAVTANETQDGPETPPPLSDVVYMAGDAVRLKDLVSPEFDPEQVLTMADYIREIGTRMAVMTREDSTKDSALHVYGKDFARARPAHLITGLIFPRTRTRPKKLVVEVSEWYCDLDPSIYRGVVPYSTGVIVSEELYELIVQNPAAFSNRIANRTEKVNMGPVIEKDEDLGGESALYGLADKYIKIEEYDKQLLEERQDLYVVSKSLDPALPINPKRVKNLEIYRFAAVSAIQTMVRLACRGFGYGTNETHNTMNAVISEIFRSPDAARNLREYSHMAIDYNDAVRGKINQSIHGIAKEVAFQADFAINNIDREYTDK